MKKILAFLVICFLGCSCGPQIPSSDLAGYSSVMYPLTPDPDLTPGQVCTNPDEYRYPERIKYCKRRVSSQTKSAIIRTYDNRLSYDIGRLPRGQFKIDHYIPLCLGGSNSTLNLWPQHKSVYSQTDMIEFQLCRLLQVGVLKQSETIEAIVEVKSDLTKANYLESQLDRLMEQVGL